jgi:hypothetical protein
MARLGFRVKELMGGLDWWKRDGHKTEGVLSSGEAAACGCDGAMLHNNAFNTDS